jgi:hypothetical protein
MSEYWDKIPQVQDLVLNLKPYYGDGYLKITPQEGPQRTFISCMSGLSEEEERDQDFYLIFYGGARNESSGTSLINPAN